MEEAADMCDLMSMTTPHNIAEGVRLTAKALREEGGQR